MPAPAVELRSATVADAEAVRTIYNLEVETSTSTMDLVPRSRAEQEAWIADRSGAFAVIVALEDAEVVGFAALSPYKPRPAYRTTVEDSVYVRRDRQGRGIGRLLLEGILDVATARGFHAVMARVEAGQEPSLGLHRSCGFRMVGTEREVGRKFNRWRDVVLLQILLHERAGEGVVGRAGFEPT